MDVQGQEIASARLQAGAGGLRNAERTGSTPGGGRLSYCFRHGPNAIDTVTAIADHVIDPAGEF